MRRPGVEGRRRSRLIAGILLAAGLSSRFGSQKLLERYEGEPLIRRAARTMIDAALEPIIVVVSDDRRLRAAVGDLPVKPIENREPERGISRSIALGITALPADQEACLIGVADQPYLTASAIQALALAFHRGGIVVPRYGDHRGNPAIFDRRFFPELTRLDGDRGGRRIVDAHPEAVVEVALASEMGEDVDRREDFPR